MPKTQISLRQINDIFLLMSICFLDTEDPDSDQTAKREQLMAALLETPSSGYYRKASPSYFHEFFFFFFFFLGGGLERGTRRIQ